MKGEINILDSKIIRERLIGDLDCKESQADGIVEKIQKLAPEIYTAFEEWFNTGKVSDIEVEGYAKILYFCAERVRRGPDT